MPGLNLRTLSIWLLSCAAAFLLLADQAEAGSARRVDCTTNPAALGAGLASANDGDTLMIRGVCKGTFEITRSLTLVGGADGTIDGQGAGTVLTIDAGKSVVVANLLITGGSDASAGGIRNGGTLSLTNSRVSGNTVGGNSGTSIFVAGGGILNAGVLAVENSTVTGNSAAGANFAAGAIATLAPGSLTLTHTSVSGNTALVSQFHNGVGGIISFSSDVSIRGSAVRGNSADASDPFTTAVAGILFSSFNARDPSQLTITGSSVSENAATGVPSDAIGGILNSGPGAVATLQNTSVRDNSGTAPGGESAFSIAVGGVENGGGSLSLTNSSVRGNTANEPNGGFLPPVGGLANYFGGLIGALTNSTVAHNIPNDCNFSDPACAI